MCEGNVEIGTRKKVLNMVHNMAVYKADTGKYSSESKKALKSLMYK